MSVEPGLIDELVTASRILARRGVVDGFGHVSMRHPGNAASFLISRSMAPALVCPDDIMTLDLDGNASADGRKTFVERFIHAEIYRARPDVHAVVHSHSPSVIPFGLVPAVPLRAVYHMSSFLGSQVPLFEIRDAAGPASDMLVRDAALGRALVAALGGASAVLMRGHGSTVVAPTLRLAVFRGVYLEINARIQAEALRLGPVTYLSETEAANATEANELQVNRAWELWCREVAATGDGQG